MMSQTKIATGRVHAGRSAPRTLII